MITTSDAIEVMGRVAICHHKTAPGMDDPTAVKVTACVWARMFNECKLTLDVLLEAVEKRAASNPDAPEPAEIISVAREIRRDRSARWDDDDQADHEAFLDAKAAGRVGSPDEWVALKAANRNRMAELINPIAAGKGLNTVEGEIA